MQGQYSAVCYLPIRDGVRKVYHFSLDSNGEFVNPDGSVLIIEPFAFYEQITPQQETSRMDHAFCIARAVETMRQGHLRKVIVSRIKYAMRKEMDVETILTQLCGAYPGAFVYWLNHPKWGEWIGATPEVLLEKEGNHFTTVALAGTLAADSAEAWSPKLVEEQGMVAEFMSETIRKFNPSNSIVTGPNDHAAGPVRHLCTTYSFDCQAPVAQLLDALHPTPAVCGLPRNEARSFIDQYEQHQRRLYTGYLGVKLPSGDALYMVNLRCMQVFDDHFELHLGGGITALSNAAEEWDETERKSMVLLNVLDV
jgi:isochorismate synthase